VANGLPEARMRRLRFIQINYLILPFLRIFYAPWYGKPLCVIGDTKTGKTEFYKYINEALREKLEREHNGKYHATSVDQVTSSCMYIDDVRIAIKSTKDYGGADAYIDNWKALYQESDICLYLMNGEELKAKDKNHINNIKDHLILLRLWRQRADEKHNQVVKQGGKSRRKQHYIVITFCDKISDLSSKIPCFVADHQLLEPIDREYRADMRVFLGSLGDDTQRRQLVKHIFEIVNDKYESEGRTKG